MEFKKNALLMLMQCMSDSSTSKTDVFLSRLTSKTLLIQVIDTNNIVKVYTYDRFIEIYDSYGLDGFVF